MNLCNVAQIPRLLFPQHTSVFKRSCAFRLSLFFPYDVSNQSEMKTTLLLTFWFWLWRMFFLRDLVFPQAASWACLFPERFKACTVLWLHVIRAALVPDKSAEENPLEHWMLQPSAEEWPTTSASQRSPARPRSAKMLKYVLSWQRSRTANLVGEGSWQSSGCRRLWNIMIFIRNDNNKKSVSQVCSKSYACLLPPCTLTNVMERISLGFLQETSETLYRRVWLSYCKCLESLCF